jgi:hypothetical protein
MLATWSSCFRDACGRTPWGSGSSTWARQCSMMACLSMSVPATTLQTYARQRRGADTAVASATVIRRQPGRTAFSPARKETSQRNGHACHGQYVDDRQRGALKQEWLRQSSSLLSGTGVGVAPGAAFPTSFRGRGVFHRIEAFVRDDSVCLCVVGHSACPFLEGDGYAPRSLVHYRFRLCSNFLRSGPDECACY